MTDFEPDFAGAEQTRAALVKGLRASGCVDPDVADALSLPDAPDRLLSHPFQVVADVNELRGTRQAVDVPEKWRVGLPARIEPGHREMLVSFYARVLSCGTRDEQSVLVNQEHLIANWSALSKEVHPVIVSVWEQRFPCLRR